MFGAVVERINGVEVGTLEDVPRLIEGSSEAQLRIEVSNLVPRTEQPRADADFGHLIVLDMKTARALHDDILRTHKIACDRRLQR
jgi:hypothetical protein